MISGIAAWWVGKKQGGEAAKKMLTIGIILFAITPLIQLVTGHAHAVEVIAKQPEKAAALEGHWDTSGGVPLYAGGWVDEKNQKTYGLYIPKFLSFLNNWDWNSKIRGLHDFPRENWPPVNFIFQTYHLMVAIGLFSIGAGLLGLYLLMRKQLFNADLMLTKWYLFALPFLIPLPHIAHETGWISAEVGRQPWIIYGLMRTKQAASVVVPAAQILFSLIMFALIYSLLGIIFLTIAFKLVKKGIGEA